MVDVKKLIVNFLVIATIASLAALSFSGSLSGQKGPSRVVLAPTVPPENAFLAKIENLPIALRENLSGRKTNLTEAAAENLAEVIVALNPTGPQTIGGKTGFVLPTSTILAAYLMMQSASQFKLSNLWSSLDAEHIILSNDDDTAASREYAQSFREIIKGTISNPDFLAKLEKGATHGTSQSLASTIVPVFSDAIRKLNALATPASLLEFHKNFLTYLEDQRNVMAVVTEGRKDPLMSLVILNSSDAIRERITKDWEATIDAYAKLDHKRLFSQSKSSPWSTIASVLNSVADRTIFVPTAMALSLGGLNPENKCGSDFASSLTGFFAGILNFFFKVPSTDSAASKAAGGGLSAALIDCQSRILTQQAKADEINIMNAKTLQYIQGAGSVGGRGDPRFITNYEDYFDTAAAEGATKAYKKTSSNICPEFLPDVQQVVFDPNKLQSSASGKPISDDTLVDQAGTVSGTGFGSPSINGTGEGCSIKNQLDPNAFFNDFAQGGGNDGWDGYYSLFMDPGNSSFGTLALSHDTIDGAAAAAESAARTKSVANQGFKSDVTCADYYTTSDGAKICVDEQIKRSGSDISSQLNAAVNSEYAAVLAANDLAEMDSELADSLGNQLLDQPQLGLSDLAFRTGNQLSGVCQSLNVPGLPSNPALASCNNMVGKITAQFSKYLNILQNIQSIIGLFL